MTIKAQAMQLLNCSKISIIYTHEGTSNHWHKQINNNLNYYSSVHKLNSNSTYFTIKGNNFDYI